MAPHFTMLRVFILFSLCQLHDTVRIGLWTLNCDYYGSDMSGYGLHMSYSPTLPTAPNFQCTVPDFGGITPCLSGAASFQSSGDVYTLKYLEANNNPGPAHLGLNRTFTWIAYIYASQSEFTDTYAPIFSFERPRVSRTQINAGMSIEWSNSALVIFMANPDGSLAYTYTLGLGFQPGRWHKVGLSMNLNTGIGSYKLTRLENGVYHSVSDGTADIGSIPSSFTPYLSGRVRIGAYPEDNSNNFAFFRGRLSCVQLFNDAMAVSEMNQEWTSIPDVCTRQIVCSNNECADPNLVPLPGYEEGICEPGEGQDHTCTCPAGYIYNTAQDICEDIDETLVNNCGCSELCTNRFVDRDGIPFECSCFNSDHILSNDGVSCIEQIPFSAYPLFGPAAGGTKISIRYGFLANTGRITFPQTVVHVDGNRLQETQVNDTHILVETNGYGDGTSLAEDASVTFLVRVDGDDVAGGIMFTYRPNPQLTDVQPLRSILAGGTLLTVSGRHIDSVAEPQLTVTGVSRSRVSIDTTVTATTLCSVQSETQMTCPMPALTLLSRRRRESSMLERVHRQVDDDDSIAEIYIGFELDGVPTYRNLSESLPGSSRVRIYVNPEFEMFSSDLKYNAKSRERLVIKGRNFDLGASVNDYTILLEATPCGETEMLRNMLSCLPPSKEPPMNKEGAYEQGKIRVNVRVGNMDVYIGRIKYVNESGDSKHLIIIGASAGAAIGFILLMILIICCCVKCRAASRRQQKYKEKAKAGKDGRHFDNHEYKSQQSFSYDNNMMGTKSVSAEEDEQQKRYEYRMSQNMFVQNDRDTRSVNNTKSGKNKTKKKSKTDDQEKYYADMMKDMQLPSIKKNKDNPNNRAKKQNSYVEDPTYNPPTYVAPISSRPSFSETNGYRDLASNKSKIFVEPTNKPTPGYLEMVPGSQYVNVNAPRYSGTSSQYDGNINANALRSNGPTTPKKNPYLELLQDQKSGSGKPNTGSKPWKSGKPYPPPRLNRK